MMNIENFHEYKYAIRHKPTQKWVQFRNDDLELIVTIIELVDFKDCFINGYKNYLEMFLKKSVFNKTLNYGKDNFLEFEFVKVKVSYTIEE